MHKQGMKVCVINNGVCYLIQIVSVASPTWAEGTVLSLCVCLSNCCKIQLSQNLNQLQVTNLVI